MFKKSIIALLVTAVVGFAGLIDFEDVVEGYYVGGLDLGDAVLTTVSGDFYITPVPQYFDPPWGGHAMVNNTHNLTTAVNILTFDAGLTVTDLTIMVGDHNADPDPVFLEAYDAFDNLVAFDTFDIPADSYDGHFLTVAATSIAYIKFYSGDPYPGSVYWDNIEYTTSSVPEPATLSLLSLGLLLMGGVKLRRRKK